MSERVTMPALGESVTEGTVTRWLKNVGDRVEVDEPLLEVSTDKVDTEIPSPAAGTLQEILVQEDDTVPVGADLAVIGEGAAAPAEPAPAAGQQSDQLPEQAAPADEPVQPSDQALEAAHGTEREPQPGTSEPETSSSPAASPAPPSSGSSGAGSSGGETVTMPALGESVTEGTVTRWLKAEGDDVAVDEPLLEVSTDKVDTEIPSPYAGTLTKILVGEDETVPVGGELAVIGGSQAAAAAPAPAPSAPAPAAAPTPAPSAPAAPPPSTAPAAPAAPEQREAPTAESDAAAYVTPLVRKLAAQHGVDLGSLKGTGVGGRIRKQDVLEAAEAAKAPAPEPAEQPAATPAAPAAPAAAATAAVSPKRGTREKMSRLRKVIAARMVESLQVSAQLTTVVEVDLTRVARLRDRAKREFEAREGTKLSYLPFLALAAVEALKAHPNVNASVEGDEIIYHASENLSIAVDTEKGLIVPVVKNAGDLNIAGLARAIADVADRTRRNKITPDDLAGGTFTITNTGSRGALFDTPIINQPQVAILGTGSIVKRPVVVTDRDGGETIAVRSMMYLALSYDHRIVDGADAARFLSTMKTRLEEGNFESSLGL
ncbi:MAG TPA: 2-oxoglutarate dehydrogenase, E2 component, dihydrolipoamide succinyltransferase [Intrasporangium sp.]|uniref:2-oxoglutarate dehydrogenase, E2 component, dihydrolipoamide succinyltransferase n=1 Tax=Intrasporangium sp. TaxID=1925024 RepID=UPI002D77C725|nr:2-oxoglutarate dehydrogenase, E2 component, dihydrolipoamide succinyltransferase [Intrasporangium sp.]HET7397479.1 2-oxoglutarate dehydrogenase, E2 component, dihydrolipoamide succinyltransferase [Intrasporangium sp.]